MLYACVFVAIVMSIVLHMDPGMFENDLKVFINEAVGAASHPV